MDYLLNIKAAWIGMLLGVLTGTAQGLFFHREDWLGGYGSWPRRMMRLGHISFFGLAFVNLAFALSAGAAGFETGLGTASFLLVAGAATMPAVCYASAFWKPARQLFFIPVGTTLLGVLLFLVRLFAIQPS